MLLIWDLDVDHILAANTIDDEHGFSDVCEGIVICMYFINFCLVHPQLDTNNCLNVQTVV